MDTKQATRIQTSLLNGVEKKALVWLAERQPAWMTSDKLTAIGFFGALMISAGYILTRIDINFLWLSTAGLLVNWYGDSLDGTLARVRNQQRPVYGYYLDHTIDGINESLMFIGAGLSCLMMHPSLALGVLVLYLLLTINVSVNAHLKSEFRLTYAKLGPTEFRVIVMIVNTIFLFVKPLTSFCGELNLFGINTPMKALDYVAIGMIVILLAIYLVTIFTDARKYSKMDPKPERKK
jgi:archaetidylinositol phosphate synthase